VGEKRRGGREREGESQKGVGRCATSFDAVHRVARSQKIKRPNLAISSVKKGQILK
jgi:hypothetical protein